nr:MAG TPA: hypothetical protein [Caudoviricetes sp.]
MYEQTYERCVISYEISDSQRSQAANWATELC